MHRHVPNHGGVWFQGRSLFLGVEMFIFNFDRKQWFQILIRPASRIAVVNKHHFTEKTIQNLNQAPQG
jgi:hypothetical protein